MKLVVRRLLHISFVLWTAAQALSGIAWGQLKISGTLVATSLDSWRPVQPGVDQRKIALARSQPNYTLELVLLRFDPKVITAKVLTSGDGPIKSATAQEFVERSRAIAAINANYFDPKGRPLAYLKTTDKEINRNLSKHALYTGVFAIIDGIPKVMHRDNFAPDQASEAVQTGPLLLDHGESVEPMRGLSRYARRAVLGIDKEGRIVVAVTDAVLGGLSFVELQELFGNPKWQIDTPDLMNLDGGGSAQLYLKSGRREESVPGTTEVPVTIGFFVKPH